MEEPANHDGTEPLSWGKKEERRRETSTGTKEERRRETSTGNKEERKGDTSTGTPAGTRSKSWWSWWNRTPFLRKKRREKKENWHRNQRRGENKRDKQRNPSRKQEQPAKHDGTEPFPGHKKKREEEGRQAPKPKKREEGRQAPEPQPEPGRTSKSWWEERRRETSTGTKEERRRETSTGTPAGTRKNKEDPANHDGTEPFPEERKKREEGRQAPEPKKREEGRQAPEFQPEPGRTWKNQQIMMEQNPFPEERKKREEGRQAPEPKKREEGRQAPEPQPEPGRTRKNQQIMMEQNPFTEERKKREEGRQAPEPKKKEEGRQAPEFQPEPGRTCISWWNRTPFLRKERREKKGDKHRNPSRKQEEPANHEGTKAVSGKNWESHSDQELFGEQTHKNSCKDFLARSGGREACRSGSFCNGRARRRWTSAWASCWMLWRKCSRALSPTAFSRPWLVWFFSSCSVLAQMLGWSYVFHGALSAGPGRQHPGVPRLRQRLRWRVVPAACLQAIAVDRSVAVSPDQAIERERESVCVCMCVWLCMCMSCARICAYIPVYVGVCSLRPKKIFDGRLCVRACIPTSFIVGGNFLAAGSACWRCLWRRPLRPWRTVPDCAYFFGYGGPRRKGRKAKLRGLRRLLDYLARTFCKPLKARSSCRPRTRGSDGLSTWGERALQSLAPSRICFHVTGAAAVRKMCKRSSSLPLPSWSSGVDDRFAAAHRPKTFVLLFFPGPILSDGRFLRSTSSARYMIQSSLDLSWPNSVTKCKRRPKPCQTINCDDMFIVNKGGTVDQLLQAIIAARQHLRSPAVVQAGFKEGPLPGTLWRDARNIPAHRRAGLSRFKR